MTEPKKTTYPKLDPEVKAKWIAALLSGAYTQGRSCLGLWFGLNRGEEEKDRRKQYCCLGVLAKEMGVLQEPTAMTQGAYARRCVLANGSETRASHCVPSLDANAEEVLIRLNDIEAANFPAIAKWIEENL